VLLGEHGRLVCTQGELSTHYALNFSADAEASLPGTEPDYRREQGTLALLSDSFDAHQVGAHPGD